MRPTASFPHLLGPAPPTRPVPLARVPRAAREPAACCSVGPCEACVGLRLRAGRWAEGAERGLRPCPGPPQEGRMFSPLVLVGRFAKPGAEGLPALSGCTPSLRCSQAAGWPPGRRTVVESGCRGALGLERTVPGEPSSLGVGVSLSAPGHLWGATRCWPQELPVVLASWSLLA